MGLTPIDWLIVGLYLTGVTVAGIVIARRQRTTVEYFLGGRTLPWWAVGCSIVASETSTLTFISVPGLAYRGDMHFLQLAFGYFAGRVLVSLLLIPAYYRGHLETAYEFLGNRFGYSLRATASSVFLVTRVLASGVRLFATAIPVHLITGLDYWICIGLVGMFTLLYTAVGGLKAVVAMDVAQLCIYLLGAGATMWFILHGLPDGWSSVVAASAASATNKFEVVNTSWGTSILSFLSTPYTLLGAVVGGTFLSMASHGTDQLLVQRLLGCRSQRDSQRALMLDASLIVLQFAFFLLLGICLYAFYGGATVQQLGLRSPDEIFPKFIVEQLPRGLSGLLVAAILASAMGTLSSSISSLASSSFLDIVRHTRIGKALDAAGQLRWSKLLTLFWGAVLIAGALLFTDTSNPVVEIGLKIASVTYGGLLGMFFLGLLARSASIADAYAGFIAGLSTMIAVILLTTIDYTWHTCIGCLITIVVGLVSAKIRTFRGGRRVGTRFPA